MSGLLIHRGQTTTALADELARQLATPRDDPFSTDLICLPHAGLQRWLAQYLAQRLGPPGEGICAGLTFGTIEGLWARLRRSVDGTPDPWQPSRLAWVLLRAARASNDSELARLQAHLAASRESVSTVRRLARNFARYATWRPELVAGWAAGSDLDAAGEPLGDDRWQAVLWRLAIAELGRGPGAEQEAVRSALMADPASFDLPPELSFFLPGPLTPAQRDLLEALAEARTVHLWQRTTRVQPEGPALHPLTQRLGRLEAESLLPPGELVAVAEERGFPPTLLGYLQGDLAADRPSPSGRIVGPGDRSIQLHSCHGLDRQVEVLRDAITARFAADQTLEPRDVVIGCADLAAAAPLITAAFTLPDSVEARHPASTFRVQLADRSAAEVNPLIGVLTRVLRLSRSRAETAELLDLISAPAVAARFGLRADQADRIAELVTRAGVRWGLSARHRAAFGMGDFAQNTWVAGLQRLLLGIALSEDGLPMVGTTLPVDDVESSDVPLVGALAELLSRLTRIMADFDRPASPAQWAARLSGALTQLTVVAGEDQWQQAHLASGLARIGDRGGEAPLLTLADIERAVVEEFAETPARPSFGNGSLIVCSLASLRQVPHRVVCLLGLDDTVFPRSPNPDGDDLMARSPQPGDPDPTLADRQLLLDAVTTATDTLIVTYSGRHPATNERLHPSSVISDLREALDATVAGPGRPMSELVTVEHPLQPFDPSYFDGELESFDPLAFRGARALAGPKRVVAPVALPPLESLDELSLDDLVSFFAHPARAFLKTRLGLGGGIRDREADEIPIELDSLESWSIGQRALRLVRAGHPLEQVQAAEWLRGTAPPGEFGSRELGRIAHRVSQVVSHLPPSAATPAEPRDLAVEVGNTRIAGRVTLSDGLLLQVEYSGLAARHRLAAWLRLLVAAAAELPIREARVVTRYGRTRFTAPAADPARQLLADLVGVVRQGLDTPLPLPARVCAVVADSWKQGLDPFDRRQYARLKRAWDWEVDDAWSRFFPSLDSLLDTPNPQSASVRGDDRRLLTALTRRVWQPLITHEGDW